MIDSIAIDNFKSLRRVDLQLGRLNLLIGANASGKSNFLDALRVLQGVGAGFAVDEIFDGKPKSATSEAWDGIRGGGAGARFAGRRDETEDQDARPAQRSDEVKVSASGKLPGEKYPPRWRFSTTLTPRRGCVARERFRYGWNAAGYDTEAADFGSHLRYFSRRPGRPRDLYFDVKRPVIGQFAGRKLYVLQEHADVASGVAALLANVQRVAPDPERLRSYSDSRLVRRMGDHGENFAALIRTICQDREAKDAYLSWLHQLRPEEVDDVGVLSGAVGEPLFMLREGGQQFPAPALSDGALRFAAIAAAFFQPDMPRLMTMEEIENGVHASRLRLLVELLRSQAETRDTQIVATTHSPLVLAWLREEEYETTFLMRARRIDGRIHDPSPDRRAPLHGRRQETADRRSAGGRLAGNGAVSFRALVVPEDPALNGYVLKPLAQSLLAEAGKPHASVKLLTDPRVRGYDEAVRVIRDDLADRCARNMTGRASVNDAAGGGASACRTP